MSLRSPSRHWSSFHRTPNPTPCVAGLPATKGVVMVFVVLESVVRVVDAVDVVLVEVVLVDVALVDVVEVNMVEVDVHSQGARDRCGRGGRGRDVSLPAALVASDTYRLYLPRPITPRPGLSPASPPPSTPVVDPRLRRRPPLSALAVDPRRRPETTMTMTLTIMTLCNSDGYNHNNHY